MDERERTLENLREVARSLPGMGPPAPSGPTVRPGEETHPRRQKHRAARWARWGGLGLLLFALLNKLKFLLIGLKFLKFGTVLTMFVSVYAYSLFWGWPFAAGFVFLILIHELGHLIVMRWYGIPAGAPTFIPFVGAVIVMKGRPRNVWVEAMVAFGGPVLGSLAALACLGVGLAVGSRFWQSLAFSGFLINLFNLLPVNPLDGGRITAAISRWMWLIGLAIGVPVFLATRSPILLIVLILGVVSLLSRSKEPPGYFAITPGQRSRVAVAYFALAALLAVGASLTHVEPRAFEAPALPPGAHSEIQSYVQEEVWRL
ncbi:MAG: site-2 protease family protein [Candidatus Eisenbacteria sp.]|nr:site-2 protease family protein [Candidatus Eisenbacteria bacterium]